MKGREHLDREGKMQYKRWSTVVNYHGVSLLIYTPQEKDGSGRRVYILDIAILSLTGKDRSMYINLSMALYL